MRKNNQNHGNGDHYATMGGELFAFDSKWQRDDFLQRNPDKARKLTAAEAYKLAKKLGVEC